MYAVVKTGGKQYTVRENEVVQVDKLAIPDGEQLTITDVLFVHGDNGEFVGTPLVEGASVTAKIVRHSLGKKVIGFTYKSKKNERNRYGHRQQFTQLLIEKITC